MAEMAPPTSQIPMDKHSPCQFKIAMAKSPRKKKRKIIELFTGNLFTMFNKLPNGNCCNMLQQLVYK